MKWSKLISELKRRNVFKSSIAYLALAWIVVQIASILFPVFETPDYGLKILIYALVFGFIVWIPVSWVYELTPGGIQKTKDYISTEKDIKFANKTLNKFIVTLITVAVLLLVVISFWAGSQWDGNLESKVFKKVAVIPFEQRVEIEKDLYFQSGLTKIIIDELSKVDQLTVISQKSTNILNASLSSGNSLAMEVISGIDYFIYGSIEKQHNDFQIILDIKETVDSPALWKKSYSGDVSGIRSLAAKASDDITRQMGLKVKVEDKLLWDNLRKVNPEIFELYLKGKHYMNKSTPQDWQRGIVYMQEAIDKNPADPYAHAYLAEAYINLGHGPAPPPNIFPLALEAATRAIQLDSTVALGWAALSHYHTYFGMDWNMAEYAFKRADELNPNLAENHYHRAWFLVLFGNINEAIDEHKRAQELDPFTPLHTSWLGALYKMAGRYEEGLYEINKLSNMENTDAIGKMIKGGILIDQGKTEEGMNILKESTEINENLKYLAYARALIQIGSISEANKIVRELEEKPLNSFRALCLGNLYARLGEFDKAFECFNYETKHAWYPWLRIQDFNNDFNKDPRFIKIIRDMNLPDPATIDN